MSGSIVSNTLLETKGIATYVAPKGNAIGYYSKGTPSTHCEWLPRISSAVQTNRYTYHDNETAHAKISDSQKKGSVTDATIGFIIQFLHK